jgi:hypothetical protein
LHLANKEIASVGMGMEMLSVACKKTFAISEKREREREREKISFRASPERERNAMRMRNLKVLWKCFVHE